MLSLKSQFSSALYPVHVIPIIAATPECRKF